MLRAAGIGITFLRGGLSMVRQGKNRKNAE